jgi:hypothetical protein
VTHPMIFILSKYFVESLKINYYRNEITRYCFVIVTLLSDPQFPRNALDASCTAVGEAGRIYGNYRTYDNNVAITSNYRGKIKENPKINNINETSFIDDNNINFLKKRCINRVRTILQCILGRIHKKNLLKKFPKHPHLY